MDARDVIVVGAGPVGLSLALGLARAGRSVLVLEREAATSEHSRAPAIWPRTLEILADLGVVGRFLERGIPLDALSLFDVDRGRAILRLPVHELADETDHAQLLILPQAETERLLCEAVRAEPTAEIAFSTEVLGVSEGAEEAVVQCRQGGSPGRVAARYVIGCDGARSRVREVLGASFTGKTYGTRAALADVVLGEGADGLESPRLTTRGSLAVAVRIDAGVWRLILPLSGGGVPLERRIERAVEALFRRTTFETIWTSEFRLHRRISSIFARGRIALAGDAAHLNSPVGGQGMNAGIADTEALRTALLEALDAGDPAPLEDYARQRRRAIERVNRFTDGLTTMLLMSNSQLVRVFLRAAALATRSRRLRRRALRRLGQLDA